MGKRRFFFFLCIEKNWVTWSRWYFNLLALLGLVFRAQSIGRWCAHKKQVRKDQDYLQFRSFDTLPLQHRLKWDLQLGAIPEFRSESVPPRTRCCLISSYIATQYVQNEKVIKLSIRLFSLQTHWSASGKKEKRKRWPLRSKKRQVHRAFRHKFLPPAVEIWCPSSSFSSLLFSSSHGYSYGHALGIPLSLRMWTNVV